LPVILEDIILKLNIDRKIKVKKLAGDLGKMISLEPLHIKAARKNILTLARFRLHHPDTPILGHTLDIYNSMRDTGLADFPMDDIPSTETPTLFQSYIDTPLPALLTDPWIHINGDEGVDPTAPVISIYTDGSKLDNQRDKKVIA